MAKFDTKLDRYPFSPIPARPAYDWPNGKRLAVYFAINIEAFEFGRSPGTDFTSMPTPPFHRGYAYRDYGNRVGIWRFFDMFDELKLPAAHNTNSWLYQEAPQIFDAIRRRGHVKVPFRDASLAVRGEKDGHLRVLHQEVGVMVK